VIPARPTARLDLRPYACPLTWVKARIALSRLAVGEVLEVLLADGEPKENVPRSAEEYGHEVLRLERASDVGGGAWRAWLRRREAREERTWP
jgi:TusA-related sulfurtransferase